MSSAVENQLLAAPTYRIQVQFKEYVNKVNPKVDNNIQQYKQSQYGQQSTVCAIYKLINQCGRFNLLN